MKQVRRSWAGSTITVVLLSFFLTGCPKRPEVAETAPKAIGPQGAIGMPAPPPSPPSTGVSAVPPTVTAPEGESPTEVTTQPEKAEVAPEAKIQEAEMSPPSQASQEPVTPPTQEAQAAPEGGAAPGPQTSEAEVKREGQLKEAEIKEPEVKHEAPAPVAEAEVKPGTSPQVKEAEVSPVTEGQVKGGDVGASGVAPPSAGEPSTAGASAAAPVEPVAPAPVPTPSALAAVAEAPKALELSVKDIYFDFDQAVIREDSKKTLVDNIQWFKANPAAKVTIEGHCDERGSSEYNLALGERRARVTRDFFVTAGIEAKRINTISFGKERPFVLGHDETAWKWNRRAHFISTTK
ncbi:MAG: peptidoglycan-associated lipoprotein Pal [candidate division NC10 bacterium]|nr:peptidoglycan-associated lipoprotein Pal [candidate division NC10 bacterium]